MKVAVTECGWTIGTVHVAVVPLGPHAPPHPPNVLPEQTLTWLERAAELRAGFMLYLAIDPTFESLHREPRFQALLKRIGLPPS